ncbi:MAG: SDR family oxidoreductase [Deltaproteobacteria bacterium]|jgi:3-oxoacyl-[acyl-carrier protein] reductase|nr:SDR family oxidoreductase [Deltaproteobacteria bacterium]MBW2503699.1 SDR family oxidoreductase [Deltaproteobacteria bacterium]
MDLHLKGKAALVTASSRGLGKAIAQELAREGCHVMLNGRDSQNLLSAAREIRQLTDSKIATQVGDLTRHEDITALVERTRSAFGRIDILINNCGGPPGGSFADFDDQQWQSAFELTLLSYIRLIRACLNDLRAAKGRIVNITSSSIRQPIPHLVLSNVFRAGVLGLSKSLADELAPDGVLVNTVAPGRIATDRTHHLDGLKAERLKCSREDVVREACKSIPLGRYGEPNELAQVVAFLVSNVNTYLTGQAIAIDGGLVRAL